MEACPTCGALLPGACLEGAGITLDPNQREVRKDGETISLTHREFDVLHALMVNRKLILTQRQLYEMVWGYDLHETSNTLHVHIGYLRLKLGRETIKTIHGVGYRFGA